ncbi:hypothetical protein OJAV_G00084530 [Oryzias javanicus]|uniref:Uncharacterized protein n=1 Tax=Oryzias javanicus TaxID=123683 RepID=A0A3S2M4E2_ORYJA|nr:hypothetical protein OJAV_G00084530 [Oryzias javanicus]
MISLLVEKYRPQKLEDLISHRDILSTIQRFIKEDRLPHLLLYGPSWNRKRPSLCARQLYKDKEFNFHGPGDGQGYRWWSRSHPELCSNQDHLQGESGPLQLSWTFFGASFQLTPNLHSLIPRKGFKLVILDEADAMTQDAQNALPASDREVYRKHAVLPHLQLPFQDHPCPAVPVHQVPLRPSESGPDDPPAGARYPAGEDELDKTISVWDSHIIRPSNNDRVPSGRPKVMYMFPELYSTNNCISPVDDADVQLCHANCTFRPTVPCDTDIYDLCYVLMAESDLQLPNDA